LNFIESDRNIDRRSSRARPSLQSLHNPCQSSPCRPVSTTGSVVQVVRRTVRPLCQLKVRPGCAPRGPQSNFCQRSLICTAADPGRSSAPRAQRTAMAPSVAPAERSRHTPRPARRAGVLPSPQPSSRPSFRLSLVFICVIFLYKADDECESIPTGRRGRKKAGREAGRSRAAAELTGSRRRLCCGSMDGSRRPRALIGQCTCKRHYAQWQQRSSDGRMRYGKLEQ